MARNYQVFDPLDFLAELTQHIPNQGEHLVRYDGHYSNKARGMRAKQGDQNDPPPPNANAPPRSPPRPRRRSRRSQTTAPKYPMPQADASVSYEVDPEYLEFILRSTTKNGHARLQALDEQHQPDSPWDA